MATTKVTTNVLADNAVTTAKITDLNVTTAKIADDNVTYAKMQDTSTDNRVLGATTAGTISEVQIVNGMMAADSVNSDQYVDGSIDTVHIADNNVTFDKIENRYTARATTSSASGTISIDWSAATTFYFSASLTGATTISFTNFKQGQVIGIYGLTGAQTITLDSDAATSETFNRIGTSEYDGTGTNFLQVACVDDSANAVFNYSIITYTADTTP